MKKVQLIIISLTLIFNSLFAQNFDEFENTVNDSLPVPENDSVILNKKVVDEDLSDIFSGQIDSANYNWYLKNAFTSDSAEVRLDNYPKNIPDSVYIQRLQKTEQVIDLSYNPAVLSFIKMYTERKRDQVERMIGLSDYYFPVIEEILDKYNLPLELKYLPIIESALNPVAISRAGAMGLWQFMYGTAKLLNMEITSFVDERRDPVKASEAAAKYLKKLFDIYNDWHLAIAAYNCGPGNVDRAIRRSGGKTNYWDIYYFLPRETRGYVPLFIAATYVMNFYGEHNLVPQIPAMPTNVDTIMVNRYLHFNQIAATLNIDKENLQALNPMYRRGVIPATESNPYPLVLPYEKVYEFIDKDTAVFAWEREKYFPNNTLVNPAEKSGGHFTPADVKGKTKIVYTVKAGDTVGGIASKYHVRANDLTYWNNIRKNKIRAGQKLAVYVPEKNKPVKAKNEENLAKTASDSNPPADKAVSENREYEYYTVKRGDTPAEIAKTCGMDTAELMTINGIRSERGLQIGQKLKIPKKS